MNETTLSPDTETKIAERVASFEAELRRQNDPAVLAEKTLRREWDHLRCEIRMTGNRHFIARFEEAEAAGNIEKAREVLRSYENFTRYRSPEQIAREKREGLEKARKAVEERQRREREAARIQALRERFLFAGDVIAEIERHGTLRLGDDGAVIYTGKPLGDDLVLALGWHGAAVRRELGLRWHDRVVLPAPEPAAPATQAVA